MWPIVMHLYKFGKLKYLMIFFEYKSLLHFFKVRHCFWRKNTWAHTKNRLLKVHGAVSSMLSLINALGVSSMILKTLKFIDDKKSFDQNLIKLVDSKNGKQLFLKYPSSKVHRILVVNCVVFRPQQHYFFILETEIFHGVMNR